MRSAIAVIMAILGVILTLGGTAAIFASGLAKPGDDVDTTAPITRADRSVSALEPASPRRSG